MTNVLRHFIISLAIKNKVKIYDISGNYYNIILLADCKHLYSNQYLLKMLSYNFIGIIHLNILNCLKILRITFSLYFLFKIIC